VLKHVRPTLLLILSMVLPAATASAQSAASAVRDQITLRGTVEGLDQKARTVTIRGDRGNVVTLDIPQSSTALDQLQLGDVVSVAYFDRVSIRVKPAGEAAVDRTEPPVATATAPAGALPGATVASQRVTTVTITAWDPGLSVVTFTGPNGATYTRRLVDATDAQLVAGLKVGDRVDVTRTEAVRLAVESRTQVQLSGTSTFDNRFTLAVLWGSDNSFSGNMIQEASGLTAGGVPINMAETTFDDVYGRMSLLKIGAAWRTTPRTEVAFNFVYSDSSATPGITVGTAGAANVPLLVDFDDNSYWGLEAGQRFFFTRVRVTPFAGYLVGIQRYGDIRGTFVNVPLEVTPGLAAQDGKFFEKSWALNLGPTGGLLVGLGPVEVIFETQLRYTGGLSDVDWLVEEGLKDINDESSRWSIPLQLGARIRF
jgi:hypothetical protein